MKLYNTRTRKIEDFTPLEDGKVKMYSCGPTVYDSAHIGNLRYFTFADILKKVLILNGYSVDQIMNITDFGHLVGDGDDGEDKMSEGLRRENLPRTLDGMKSLADKYTNLFLDDIKKMNISPAKSFPRASKNIEEYIKIIETLDKKGFVYRTSDGLYFDTAKDPNYGFMSTLDKSDAGQSRIGVNSEKKNPADFALWKFGDGVGFESPFGFGFPGWHIECSGMAYKFLGEQMDIHTGGIDHINVHHTNEIAQSENFTGKTYANFFCHCAFLDIDNTKMSKSKNNFFSMRDIEEKGIAPLAFRYLILGAHYRQNLNFTWESLQAAQNALLKLEKSTLNIKSDGGKVSSKYFEEFKSALDNDLNTAQALATLWEMLKDENVSDDDKYATAIKMDEVLSLDLGKDIAEKKVEITPEIATLIEERKKLRSEKKYTEADEIRNKLISLGIEVKD